MKSRTFLFALLTGLLTTGSSLAADFSDPTWPCVQRKVESLSLGIMWPHPVADEKPRTAIADSSERLAETLALRRISMEDGRGYVAAFAAENPDLSLQDFGTIFRKVFERIGRDRSQIIRGIERYSLSQIALAASINESRNKMSLLMQADNPDFDQVDSLEEKVDWDERIFRDRAQSLAYVCETPVILEKRAYAVAQLLLEFAPK